VVFTGDVDGDGDLDLVAGNFVSDHQVWTGDAANPGRPLYFRDEGLSLTNASFTQSIALGDVDQDGDMDRNGDGDFDDIGDVDLNGDGQLDADLDLVIGNTNSSHQIWLRD
jgi:hypothetical protein